MAEEFLTRAAVQGHPNAHYILGIMNRKGQTISRTKDAKKAFKHFSVGVELQHPGCCYSLAVAYFGGDTEMVGDVDLYRALELFQKAEKFSDGQQKVPEQLIAAIKDSERREKKKENKAKKERSEKMNETIGIAAEARESGHYNYMAGAVAVGLVAIFGFHWLASRQ